MSNIPELCISLSYHRVLGREIGTEIFESFCPGCCDSQDGFPGKRQVEEAIWRRRAGLFIYSFVLSQQTEKQRVQTAPTCHVRRPFVSHMWGVSTLIGVLTPWPVLSFCPDHLSDRKLSAKSCSPSPAHHPWFAMSTLPPPHIERFKTSILKTALFFKEYSACNRGKLSPLGE